VIMQWLAQGAKGPNEAQQKELENPSVSAQKEIEKWERFLNQDDAKHAMTARYLYEHYILAHLNFKASPEEFYTLVRSSTPPGEKIDVIATLRAYDDPKTDTFYYRFEKIHSSIVHKTHIVVELADEKLERIKVLFIETPWMQEPYLVGYEDKALNANPFLVFAQIPPASRYQFMLDASEYFVRTFIRSPSCRGQIALNVIQDHFWVMFQDPRYDIGVIEKDFLVEQADNLRMPIETGSDKKIYKVFSDSYRNLYEQFYDAKMHKTAERAPNGWPIEGIWKGRLASDAPALTIYRHFDSASVHKGTLGELPKTMWVIDYAQFERIYYALVVGFDVFGNVSHQTNVRRYMDFLRLEGEINFNLYMPEEKRREILASWYLGDGIADDIQKGRDNAPLIHNSIIFQTDQPKRELIERLVDTHFIKETGIHFDKINYFRSADEVPSLPTEYKTRTDYERGLRALTAPGTGFVRYVVDNEMNVAFVRVRMKNAEEIFGSFVINRWHDNVNSLFGETNRLDPRKDTLDILNGSVGSYPNIFFDVKEEELPDFFDMLKNFKEEDVYVYKLKKYAISRSDKDFWSYFDWFQDKFYENDPLNAGLYDLNRYYRKPWDKKETE
jgi:fatty acid cis/trans isomerase CTI